MWCAGSSFIVVRGQHTSCGQGVLLHCTRGFSLIVFRWLLRVVAFFTLVAVGKGLLSSCGGVSNLVLTRCSSLVALGINSSCGGVPFSSCIVQRFLSIVAMCGGAVLQMWCVGSSCTSLMCCGCSSLVVMCAWAPLLWWHGYPL